MQVIKVEDLSEEQLSGLKSFTEWFSPNHSRVIKFTILCDDNEVDWVTYHIGNGEKQNSYFLREANKHQTEDISSIENFCNEYEVLLRIGKPIEKILLMDEKNILNFSTDLYVLKRARQ